MMLQLAQQNWNKVNEQMENVSKVMHRGGNSG